MRDSGGKGAIDGILDEMTRAWPGMDAEPMLIFGHIARLAEVCAQYAEKSLEPHGLGWGEFAILLALLRAGPPHRMTRAELARSLMRPGMASGYRLRQLEGMGFLSSDPDPGDRRGVVVALTPAGFDQATAAMKDHGTAGGQLLAGLTAAERKTLASLLRKLLGGIEGFDGRRGPRKRRTPGAGVAAAAQRPR